ncbi:putative ABC transporter permease [Gordonibacter sp.]|uniref:putative ABC transporter permease n=1 Tax=Gordonibacter sp. TaxID=1968902 RepID=UPI002FCA08CE
MAKEPKTTDSPDKGAGTAVPPAGSRTVLREFGQEVKAQVFHNTGYLSLNYFTILWLFAGACVFGLVVETVFHVIVYGSYESRAGLVWGPFSPIYGVGAVALTVFLNRFYHSHNLVIFLISMVVGSVLEYVTSWGMEFFWGAIAWDYSGTFGSIGGRTNFAFGMMWGMLGLVWVRIVLPLVKRLFMQVSAKSMLARIITAGMTAFLAVDITVTVMALDREGQRAVGIPATTWEQQFFDEHFPDSYLQSKMQNMSVYGKK